MGENAGQFEVAEEFTTASKISPTDWAIENLVISNTYAVG
jgi:hypothetical protein